MSREKEEKLLAEQNELRLQRRAIAQRIAQARAVGKRDDTAINRLAALADKQLKLQSSGA